MSIIESISCPPVGYTSVNIEDEYCFEDSTDDRFVSLNAKHIATCVTFPEASEANLGDTFWVGESGGFGALVTNDVDTTTINPATLAVFVSKGTHWECVVSNLPWS